MATTETQHQGALPAEASGDPAVLPMPNASNLDEQNAGIEAQVDPHFIEFDDLANRLQKQ